MHITQSEFMKWTYRKLKVYDSSEIRRAHFYQPNRTERKKEKEKAHTHT